MHRNCPQSSPVALIYQKPAQSSLYCMRCMGNVYGSREGLYGSGPSCLPTFPSGSSAVGSHERNFQLARILAGTLREHWRIATCSIPKCSKTNGNYLKPVRRRIATFVPDKHGKATAYYHIRYAIPYISCCPTHCTTKTSSPISLN